MTSPALEFRDVTKSFGRVQVLHELSFSIPQGVVCGFIGANGAGKTTTYSIVGGFIDYRAGEVLIDGQDQRRYFRDGNLIGLLPQDMLFYEERTLSRQLYLFARLAGFSSRTAHKEVSRVLEAVDLLDRAKARPHQLSRGMRVRLGVAQALIGSPKLILLDEPMAGLDPRMKKNIREVVERLRGTSTIIISSHELSELEEMCDYFCIIDQGKLVRSGPRDQILRQSGEVFYLLSDLSGAHQKILEAFSEYELTFKGDELCVVYDTEKYTLSSVNRRVLLWLLDQNIQVHEVRSAQSLEQAYLSATEK